MERIRDPIEVEFDPQQSLMAMQMAKAEEYAAALKNIYNHPEANDSPSSELDERLLEFFISYNDTKHPEIKLLAAERLADDVTNMVKSKTLRTHQPIVRASNNYRAEIFVADILLENIDVLDANRCQLCSDRPIVFPANKACVTCQLTNFH
jgi:hypothetical protein